MKGFVKMKIENMQDEINKQSMVVDTTDHIFFHPRTESKPVKDIDFALDQTNYDFLQILSESEEIEVKLEKTRKEK